MNIWEEKRQQVNKLVQELQKKPDHEKHGHYLNPGSILNAYREGDLLFDDAVHELDRWATTKYQKSERFEL